MHVMVSMEEAWTQYIIRPLHRREREKEREREREKTKRVGEGEVVREK